MENKQIYSTAFLGSRSPGYRTEKPEFYRCRICGNVIVKYVPLAGKAGTFECSCCGEKMQLLTPQDAAGQTDEHQMAFNIFGGFEHNTIRITVDEGHHPMSAEHHIEWIYLRTFQGGQMKYLTTKGKSVTMFSLANEDAFVFCGRDVCKYCKYQCKRGHYAYAYCNQHGLFELKF